MKKEGIGVIRISQSGYGNPIKRISIWRNDTVERKRGLAGLLEGFEEGTKIRVVIEVISGGAFEEAIR